MAVIAYTGLMGSGKSYGVVENVILPAIQAGRAVYTNVPLNVESITAKFPVARIRIFTSAELLEPGFLESIPGGAVIAIDEAGGIWPGGTKWANVPLEQRDFFTMHRHKVGPDGFSQEIAVIVQDLQLVAAGLRQLVAKTYICKKLDALALSKRYRVDCYDGGQTGQNPPEARRIAQFFGTYKKEVYQFYKSHTLNKSSIGEAGLERVPDKRGNVFKSPAFLFGCAIIPVLLGFSYWAISSAVAPYQAKEKPPVKASSARPVPASRPAPQSLQVNPVQVASESPLSTDWRLVAVLGSVDYKRGILEGPAGQRVIDMTKHSCYIEVQPDRWACTVDGRLVTMYSGFNGKTTFSDKTVFTASQPLKTQIPQVAVLNHTEAPRSSAPTAGRQAFDSVQ